MLALAGDCLIKYKLLASVWLVYNNCSLLISKAIVSFFLTRLQYFSVEKLISASKYIKENSVEK